MRRWSPNRSNGLTTVGEPKTCMRAAIAGETVRVITGRSGRSSAAVWVTARFASSSSVIASTPSQRGWPRPATARWPGSPASPTSPGTSAWYGVEVEVVDAAAVAVDHHEPPAERVQRAGQQLTGLPVAGDQQERLAEPPDLAGEVLQRQRLAEAAVLHQGQQRADGVGPADHRQVDRDGHPHPLVVGEGVAGSRRTRSSWRCSSSRRRRRRSPSATAARRRPGRGSA